MNNSTPEDHQEPEAHGVENAVLKANMARLVGSRSVGKLRADMAERGFKIGTGTLWNALRGKSGNVTSLDKIAEFFGVTADQLLQPDLGNDVEAWPFSRQLQERVATLSEQKLLSLEVAMWHHLEEEAPEDVQTRLRQARAKVERLTEQVAGVEQVTPLQETIRKV